MAMSEYGIRKRADAACQLLPREPATKSRTRGTANSRSCPASPNRIEYGCSRSSDGIVGAAGQEMIADARRHAVLQSREMHARVVGAGGEDHQRAQVASAFERTLRHIGVLDPGSRHVDHAAPHDAALDLDSL